jgi:hypothetical protein
MGIPSLFKHVGKRDFKHVGKRALRLYHKDMEICGIPLISLDYSD